MKRMGMVIGIRPDRIAVADNRPDGKSAGQTNSTPLHVDVLFDLARVLTKRLDQQPQSSPSVVSTW